MSAVEIVSARSAGYAFARSILTCPTVIRRTRNARSVSTLACRYQRRTIHRRRPRMPVTPAEPRRSSARHGRRLLAEPHQMLRQSLGGVPDRYSTRALMRSRSGPGRLWREDQGPDRLARDEQTQRDSRLVETGMAGRRLVVRRPWPPDYKRRRLPTPDDPGTAPARCKAGIQR